MWSFFFEPLEPAVWEAGQSIRLELPRKTWGVDERRFTIASAPFEQHIRITTRISQSDFKQALAALDSGAEINGANIEGDFVWGDWGKARIFIAGGIGITPFRAILAEKTAANEPLNTALMYSSRDTPPVFLDELKKWAVQDDTFILHVTPERISLPLIKTNRGFLNSLVYISGAEQMVRELGSQALANGLPQAQLKTDLFTGSL